MLGLEFEYGFIKDIKACARAEHGVKTQSGFFGVHGFPPSTSPLSFLESSPLLNSKEKEENSCIF